MAYLFTHFIGEQPQGEQIYFSLSKDGLHWKDLHDGKPVICSEVGECGLRDPFLIRKADGSGFVIIATDLCIANGRGWDAAVKTGSKNLAVMESKDQCQRQDVHGHPRQFMTDSRIIILYFGHLWYS